MKLFADYIKTHWELACSFLCAIMFKMIFLWDYLCPSDAFLRSFFGDNFGELLLRQMTLIVFFSFGLMFAISALRHKERTAAGRGLAILLMLWNGFFLFCVFIFFAYPWPD